MDATHDSNRSRSSTPVTTVLEAVAEREDVAPVELTPPLQAVIDTDALNALFAPTPGGLCRSAGSVTFEYCGYEVHVASDGNVSVTNRGSIDGDVCGSASPASEQSE